jgi:hypothetical protein
MRTFIIVAFGLVLVLAMSESFEVKDEGQDLLLAEDNLDDGGENESKTNS